MSRDCVGAIENSNLNDKHMMLREFLTCNGMRGEDHALDS